ncbi:MAG: PilZ domain-containing protein, partial [Candidatus Omnitrophota bacterium]
KRCKMAETERRQHERLKRKFVVAYHVESDPATTFDISQIKDISLGGMRFVTSCGYPPETSLIVELQTPFIRDKILMKAKVLESKEIIADMIYDTRVIFTELDEEARHYVAKAIEVFLKRDKEKEGV